MFQDIEFVGYVAPPMRQLSQTRTPGRIPNPCAVTESADRTAPQLGSETTGKSSNSDTETSGLVSTGWVCLDRPSDQVVQSQPHRRDDRPLWRRTRISVLIIRGTLPITVGDILCEIGEIGYGVVCYCREDEDRHGDVILEMAYSVRRPDCR